MSLRLPRVLLPYPIRVCYARGMVAALIAVIILAAWLCYQITYGIEDERWRDTVLRERELKKTHIRCCDGWTTWWEPKN